MEENTAPNTGEEEAAFQLTITDDKLKVLLSCPAVEGDFNALAQQISNRLIEMRVKLKPDMDALLVVLNESREKEKHIADYCVVEGIPPIMPIHGKVEWTGDYFNEGYYIDPETKRIDFHRKVGNPNVEKGQLLARVQNDRQGKAGKSVYGNSIDVPKANKIHLTGGVNIVWDEKESGFRSTCTGRVVLKGQTLVVDETLYVKNGVGNDSGNIVHNGQVIINGDIDSDFSVDVSGGVEVRGLIYACDIKCGGNLVAKEGINENPAKKIIVNGDILAKYILNANIEAHGQIIANREIFQSTVKTKGEVHCKKGRILGGEVIAGQGIFVSEAGSKGSARTVLIAGIDFQLQNKLKSNLAVIAKLKEAIRQLKPVHKRLDNMRSYLTADQKEKLTELEFKIYEAENGIENLEFENKEVRKQIYANKNAQIVIYDMIYPGVVLRVFDSQFIVENALVGPVVAGLDPITGEIALSSELASSNAR